MAKQECLNSSAVENTILNILVGSEKNYEYPSLQKEAVNVISTNISQLVYDTLKQKSIASSSKRCNLLKFLNHMCQTEEHHLDKNNYKIYLKAYKHEFCKTNNMGVEKLLHDITQELGDVSTDLKTEVGDFYKRKNEKRKQRIKKLEFIRQKDEEKLDLSLGVQLSKNISYYETCEILINNLLGQNDIENNNYKNKPAKNGENSEECRKKQIKFCYALTNFGDKEDMEMLEWLLQKLSRYNKLEQLEIQFLMDFWLYSSDHHLDVNSIITENFPFIVEKMIIQFCTKIVKLKDDLDVSRYFTNLDTDPKVQKIRTVCTQNPGFYCKMKSLIFELYVFSYCNRNVYRFCNYII